MTRKDFEMMAACIRGQRVQSRALYHTDDGARDHALSAIRRVALALALECSLDNPRFDRARFIQACGLPPTDL